MLGKRQLAEQPGIVSFYTGARLMRLLFGCNASLSPFPFFFLLPAAAISPLTPEEWRQPRALSLMFFSTLTKLCKGFERLFSDFGLGWVWFFFGLYNGETLYTFTYMFSCLAFLT